MKMLEHVEEGLSRQRVEIDVMQCGFMLGCGTTDAIFIVRQLHRLCGSIWPRCTMPGIFVDIYFLKATILNY